MRVGNRLFPYPVLNNEQGLNLYKNSYFTFNVNIVQSKEHLVLENAHYVIENHYFEKLINSNKVKVICIVECSSTIFRKSFELEDIGNDIKINLNDLNGKVVISAYAYALEQIDSFWDSDFLDDYAELDYNIEKYDILAIDDGYTTKIVFDEEQDNKVSSIFLVTKNLSDEEQEMKVTLDQKKIVINVPKKQFDFYEQFKANLNLKNLFFTFFIVPSLTYALEKIKNDDFESISMNYDWFESVKKAYKNKTDTQLTKEEFENNDAISIMQVIMDYPLIKAFDEVQKLIFTTGEEDDYE